MAETLGPNPKPKQRPSFISPPAKSQFFIGPNNDELERAQARARRATAAGNFRDPASTSPPCLEKSQIIELYHNCVKLSTENKITQKNTWELYLIDHFAEIIKAELENDSGTNFQKASCTLEAGVKIYATRVDSLYCDAYKVLFGINRVGIEDEVEQDHVVDDSNIINGQEESKGQKDQKKKFSPLSTLEPSFAAINIKKFDVAFAVDPLYHQTSAQCDEGGAKGLLLNNLGVYANCRILFDSLEIPGKCESSLTQTDGYETIDLSFAKEYIEPMVSGMLSASDVSPSLSAIVDQFDQDNRRPSDVYSSQADENLYDNNDLDGDECSFDHNDQTSCVIEGPYDHDPSFSSHQDVSGLDNESSNFHDDIEDERYEGVDDYIFSSLGFSMKQNAWAGPSHWKYKKVKDLERASKESGPPNIKKTNKKADSDIDFLSAVNMDLSRIFVPPKNPKTLLLPGNREPCNTKLPEDCHYQPEDLVKLFLLPCVLCLGRSGRKRTDKASEHADTCGEATAWDEEDCSSGTFDDGHAYSDIEESSTLVSQPRQVNRIKVNYESRSKQVDVHALKATLWDHILRLNGTSVQEETPEDTISFKQALGSFPDSCRAAASLNDISPHLCFICLLHLANEHGLRIHGSPSLDDLSILRFRP